MFSRRLPWHLPSNRLSQLLLAKQQAGAKILDLTVSNPTVALPELYHTDGDSLLAALTNSAGLRYLPSPRGDAAARQAIAGYYERRALGIDPEKLVLCASTSEAYSWLFALLCEPGERVLFPQPSYPLLEFLGGLSGIAAAPYALAFDSLDRRFRIDFESLAAAVTERTRAIVVVSPNNPTGSLLRRADFLALTKLCATQKLALIVDEVFGDYRLGAANEDVLPSVLAAEKAMLDELPLCFVLSGLSKVMGLPQLKLGWIATLGGEPLRTLAQDRLEMIADTFLSVSTPVQLAAPSLLAKQPRLCAGIKERLAKNLTTLRAAIQNTALEVLPVEGGFYAVIRLPNVCSEEEWVETLLEKDDLYCHPGYFFDLFSEPYLVISLLVAPADLDAGLARLITRTQLLCDSRD